jgi:Holliday junction resolvase-like predicted endonuclease
LTYKTGDIILACFMLRKKLGNKGEQIAAQYYQSLGWQIVVKNFWTRYGELDLVLQKNKQILVVEVKTRRNNNFGWAEESIDEQKILRMQEAYQILKENRCLPDFYKIAICIVEIKNNKAKIKTLQI